MCIVCGQLEYVDRQSLLCKHSFLTALNMKLQTDLV